MSPHDQQVAIAEYCGWTEVRMGKDYECNDNPWNKRVLVGIHPEAKMKIDVPDYLDDLNAMHEAEECLTFVQWTAYQDFLIEDIAMEPGCVWRGYQTTHATAEQKAKAYIKAIGKWNETK